jgi:hypothetical protein
MKKKCHYKTKTTDDNILDRVDEWMEGEADILLHEYLGLTLEEYKRWIETGYL